MFSVSWIWTCDVAISPDLLYFNISSFGRKSFCGKKGVLTFLELSIKIFAIEYLLFCDCSLAGSSFSYWCNGLADPIPRPSISTF